MTLAPTPQEKLLSLQHYPSIFDDRAGNRNFSVLSPFPDVPA